MCLCIEGQSSYMGLVFIKRFAFTGFLLMELIYIQEETQSPKATQGLPKQLPRARPNQTQEHANRNEHCKSFTISKQCPFCYENLQALLPFRCFTFCKGVSGGLHTKELRPSGKVPSPDL
eukprot:783976-Amphidinium_carterae.1